MNRTLTITRKNNFQGGGVKWAVKLDGFVIAKIGNGETLSFRIDERPHHLEIVMLSAFGTPTRGIDPATALIMAGRDNCNVTISLSMGLVKNKINVDCAYDAAQLSESDFVDAVTRCIVNIFNGTPILERLEDPNNRRKDLGIHCVKDGVHIRWQEVEATHWSLGYGEEIIPYEAAGVTTPKEQLTDELLTRLESSIKNAILTQTRFVKNEYGCFVLGNKKSSLY